MAMIEITFSADADLLDRAEQIAKEKGTTLENEIRQWLKDFGSGKWKLSKTTEESPKPQKG
jgi:hypothetical protein